MPAPILITDSLSKSFSAHAPAVLQDFTFELPQGEITALLGPNGAGKTTLFRLLLQIITPSKGVIIYQGEPLGRTHLASIGYLPEERGLYPQMTVEEHLLFLGKLRGLSAQSVKSQTKDWFDRLAVAASWQQKIATLSKGTAQKIQFIAAILHRPSLLILDEPLSGLDPLATQLLQTQLVELQKEGTTIVLSSHHLENLEKYAHNLVLMYRGKKLLQNTLSQVRSQFAQHSLSEIFIELLQNEKFRPE